MKAILFWFGGFLSTIVIFFSFLVGLMCGYDSVKHQTPGRYSNPSYNRRTTYEPEHRD